eukprot:1160126-Pelagomonas_calceolata.AAC.2
MSMSGSYNKNVTSFLACLPTGALRVEIPRLLAAPVNGAVIAVDAAQDPTKPAQAEAQSLVLGWKFFSAVSA